MPQYGEVRVDFITYTTGETPNEGNVTVPISGLINSPTFSGDVVIEGDLTVSGDIIASGVTISGITGLFASGTETAPSISFVDDTDTGFYNAAANEVRITTNGNDRLTVDSAGNVGIGTTSPTKTLDLVGSGSGATIRLNSNVPDGTTSSTIIAIGDAGKTNAPGGIRYSVTAGGQASLGLSALSTAQSDRQLTILDNGNVGIGTTSPNRLLHLVSSTAAVLRITSADGSGAFVDLGTTSDPDGGRIVYDSSKNLTFNTDSSERMRIDSSGKVGIGTTDPGGKIDVFDGTSVDAYFGKTTDSVSLKQSGTIAGIHFGSNRPGQTEANRILQYDRQNGLFQYLAGTNGSETAALTINNNGNVGIGTTDPTTKLVIQEFSDFTLNSNTIDYTAFLQGGLTQGDGNYGASLGFSRINSAGRTGAVIAAKQTTNDGDQLGIAFLTHPSANTNTDLVEQMLIRHDGNVGIGTTNPSELLHLNADEPKIRFQSSTANALISLIGDDLYLSNDYTSAGANPSIQFWNAGAERVRIDANGNVGIGTTSPQSELVVRGSTPQLTLEPATDTQECRLQFALTDGTIQSTIRGGGKNGKAILFTQTGTEKMRLDSSGRLLVGTTSARANFDNGSNTALIQAEGINGYTSGIAAISNRDTANINFPAYLRLARSGESTLGSNSIVSNNCALGRIDFSGADGTEFVNAASITAEVDGTPGANDMPGRLMFSTTPAGSDTPTERMRLSANGRFNSQGIYDFTTASAANVFVASDGNVVRSTSSSKYKTQVEAADYHYSEALLGCEPVWYKSTCAGDNPEWGWWGFIAEDVAEIDPRLVHWKTVQVTYDENGAAVQAPCHPEPEGVAYDRFVPHLINLIKRQKEQIETMEARLSALEAK